MKLPARIVVWLLPFALTGCFHRSHPAPQQPLAPPVEKSASETPPPEPTTPVVQPSEETTQDQTATPATASTSKPKSEAPRPPVRHKKPVNKNPQMASNGSLGVSAIGQLSSGNPGDYTRQTEESIASAERNLRGINRMLNDQDQRTLAHIREFLKQAHHALSSGDVDGAHTLAAKAHVLLNELSR